MKWDAKSINYSLQNAGAVFSIWFIVAFLWVAFSSLTYPFQLEWIEGQSMDTVQRVREGLAVYAEPNIEYVSLLYTPLFYFFSAFMSLFTGMDFIAGRLTSTLAIIAACALIMRWTRAEGGNWQTALCGAGLLCATYRLSGRWFDIARVDSLAIFFVIASLYALRFGQTTRAAITTGLLICAAFFTKQTTLLVLLPVISIMTLYTLLSPSSSPKRFMCVLCLTTLLSLAATIALYEYMSGGWFSFFVFKVPMGHHTDRMKYWNFWQYDVVIQQGFVLAAALLGMCCVAKTQRPLAIFYATILMCILASTYSSRLHMYGWINNLIPLHAMLALLAVLGLSRLTVTNHIFAPIASGLILLQLLSSLYDPHPLIPTAKAVEMGNNFLEEIRKHEGDAFLPDIQFIPPHAGKKTFSYGMGAYDVFRADLGKDNAVKAKLGKELETAIAQEKFGVIIPGRQVHYALPQLNQHYHVEKTLDYPEGFALDSHNTRQVSLYVPTHSTP